MKHTPLRKISDKQRERNILLMRLKLDIIKEQGFQCARCGNIIGWIDSDLHHVKKRSLGGKDVRENLVVLCQGCHRIKLHTEEMP